MKSLVWTCVRCDRLRRIIYAETSFAGEWWGWNVGRHVIIIVSGAGCLDRSFNNTVASGSVFH